LPEGITVTGLPYPELAHVITANAIIAEHEGRIALLTIYDKEDASTVKLNVIKKMAHELGFDV